MAAATKTTIGIAAGIQPRRRASDFSLSSGSEVGDEVVPYPNTSLASGYTMPMNTTSHGWWDHARAMSRLPRHDPQQGAVKSVPL
jgi:hypothetical protein